MRPATSRSSCSHEDRGGPLILPSVRGRGGREGRRMRRRPKARFSARRRGRERAGGRGSCRMPVATGVVAKTRSRTRCITSRARCECVRRLVERVWRRGGTGRARARPSIAEPGCRARRRGPVTFGDDLRPCPSRARPVRCHPRAASPSPDSFASRCGSPARGTRRCAIAPRARSPRATASSPMPANIRIEYRYRIHWLVDGFFQYRKTPSY